jgi:hypothetical protein
MKLPVFTLCAIAMLAGCHRDPASAPTVKAAPKAHAPLAAKAGPTPQEMTAGMVEAATQGKSVAPVALKFDLLQRPVRGQPLEVAIALLPQVVASSATIQVTGSEGLQLAEGDGQIEFAAMDPSQVYRHNIKLTPTAEGVFLLNLSISLKHDQTADSRNFSVPIIVAPGAPSSATQPDPPAAATAPGR